MKKWKSEKGSITLFVLIALLFFIGVLFSSYLSSINSRRAQDDATKRVKEIYEKDVGRMNEIYKEIEDEQIKDILLVGDYVEYTPQNTITSYSFDTKYTGAAVNQTIQKDDTLKWRILNINDDYTVDLICEKATSQELALKGARGYANGVYLLNDLCNQFYSNSSIGATARSLNVEDIQNKMEKDATGEKAYEKYASFQGVKYGQTYQVTLAGHNFYPKKWKEDNGIIGESKSGSLVAYNTEVEAVAEESPLTVTHTYWNSDNIVMKDQFPSAKGRKNGEPYEDPYIYYNLLCDTAKTGDFWLASRCVGTKLNETDSAEVSFAIRQCKTDEFGNGGIYGRGLYASYNYVNEDGTAFKIRPVVTLNIEHFDIVSGYNQANGWKLKI